MFRLCGVNNAARTEVRLLDPVGHYDSNVAYFDRKAHTRTALEIAHAAITKASISGSGVLAGPDAARGILRARERERRRCARIPAIAERNESNALLSLLCSNPAAALALVRRSTLGITTVTKIK